MGAFSVVKGVAKSRWLVVVATFFIMACTGATYNFSIYSHEMKLRLHYDQKTVTTIGFFKDLGANVGIFSGLLYDLTGPWLVLACGAVLNIFGYLMIWLAVAGKISAPAVWKMCLYMCIGANSQAFANTGVIVTTVKNFPGNRGLVIGLLKGYVGLSGAMLTLMYQALYGDHPVSFILLIAWLPTLVSLMFMFIVRRMKPREGVQAAEAERKIFMIFLYIALILAGYLMVIIIVENLDSVQVPRAGYQALATVMLLIVVSPIAVIVKDEVKKMKTPDQEEFHKPGDVQLPQQLPDKEQQQHQKEASGSGSKQVPESGNEQALGPETVGQKWKLLKLVRVLWQKPPPRGTDYSILEAIFSLDMLIIFVGTTCGVGAGLMAIDNLGQIGASLGYSRQSISMFVKLVGIWNFLGRVGSGFISELALRHYAVPRTLFFAVAIGLAAVSHIILAFNLPGALFAGSILLGVTFGAQWALMFTIISELFGLKYYGTLYNVGGVASPLGSYLLSVRVAGTLYDREAAKQSRKVTATLLRMDLVRRLASSPSSSTEELLCHGSHCFRNTFFIMAGVCGFGCCVMLILAARTRPFYARLSQSIRHRDEAVTE